MEPQNAFANPRVGVSAIIFNNAGQVVAGMRKGSHGAGMFIDTYTLPEKKKKKKKRKKKIVLHCRPSLTCYLVLISFLGTLQFPGGHLEFGEAILACAERETLEETGLEIRPLEILAVTNDIFEKEGKHYITIFVKCVLKDESSQPKVSLL
jgi:8-oxo-dGTP diphosphatase